MSSSGESNFAFSGITRTRQSAPDGYRVAEHRTLLGTGPGTRDRAMAEIMQWGVKRRAGFRVTAGAVVPGAEFVISMGPIREPVRVSWVAENGFGYETLVGHPLSGEEAFVVELDDRHNVWFVNRSVSRPDGAWRRLAPLLRIAQSFFVRRYGLVLKRAVGG